MVRGFVIDAHALHHSCAHPVAYLPTVFPFRTKSTTNEDATRQRNEREPFTGAKAFHFAAISLKSI
jgi:hypothetical protein